MSVTRSDFRTEHERPRIAILGANLATGNLGVSALVVGAVKCLLTGYPDADIWLLDYAKAPGIQSLRINGKQLRIPLINMRFSKRLFLPNNIAVLILASILLRFLPFDGFRKWLISQNHYLEQLLNVDLFASLAGGDSFSDIYGLERLLYVSLPQILALLLGKQLILLPQTIGPFKSAFARSIARYILRRADRIYSRDERSIEALNKLAGNTSVKTRFCYDVGFTLDPIAPPSVDMVGLSSVQESRPLAGLNVSGLLLMGGYSQKNMFGLRSNYRELIRSVISFLIEEKKMRVLLIPHVFSQDAESDVAACEEIYSSFTREYEGRLGILRGQYDQSEIKCLIGKCDFFIGARMHACIAAVSQGVPAICMAYSDKFIGVMESIGVADIVIDARKLDTTDTLIVIGRRIDGRVAVRRLLEQKMPEVRNSVMNLCGDLVLAEPTHRSSKASERVPLVYRSSR